jgi:hypothetical protein
VDAIAMRSTGPRTIEGEGKVSRNAYKGGWREQERMLESI